MRARLLLLSSTCAAMLAWAPARALTINFTTIAGDSLTATELAAFEVAAQAWESVITTDVTLTISIGFTDLGTASNGALILGGASPVEGTVLYSSFTSQLASNATDAIDAAAVASLPNSVTGNTVRITTANARALGYSYSGSDGLIQFTDNSGIAWQFTRNADGSVSAGSIDFISVAEHEIGHLLGFISDVGVSTTRSALDLFRYSSTGSLSYLVGQSAYFSLDGGVTDLEGFSDGTTYQASHWLAGSDTLMQPALGYGVTQGITGIDLAALDALGWDLSSTALSEALVAADLPEPAGLLVLAGGLVSLVWLWRRPGAGVAGGSYIQ